MKSVYASCAALILGALGMTAAQAQTAAPFQCPTKGGDLTYGQAAKANSLDQAVSNTVSTRNIAQNIFESLMTRDQANNPIPQLAESVSVSPDGMTYTFKLRHGVKFHNGKEMTAADVSASHDRYKRVGWDKAMLVNVDRWSTPDPYTFVIHMKNAQPTFLDAISSFLVPLIIIPSELADAEPMRLPIVGTGPFELEKFVPDSYVKLKRFEKYTPNTAYSDITGFGGYKQACIDSVTIRFVSEAGARVAGLQTGELNIIENLPVRSKGALEKDKAITIEKLENAGVLITTANYSAPPTDNLLVRKAVQAALDMDEIMDAATDGSYRLNVGLQYPGNAAYSESGKEFYNLKNPDLAKRYLKEAGYKGEPVVLLTNKDYPAHYNAAVVMAAQLTAVGINAKLRVLDWPTSIQTFEKESTGWNYFFTTWFIAVALGPLGALSFLAPPQNTYKPKGPDSVDKVLETEWADMQSLPTAEERNAAFARGQFRVMEQGMALPFGTSTLLFGVRSDVKNFRPFLIPRFSNVYVQK